MQTTSVNLYSLSFSNIRLYFAALVFTIGNILLPQLAHLVPNGGNIFLPIFFFTLIGAYKYGYKTGLLIATLSPVINSLLFNMPLAVNLPVIILKGAVLAITAGFIASKFKKVTLPLLIVTVIFYQVAGAVLALLFISNINAVTTGLYLAIPGMLLQIFGGYLILKHLITK